MLSAYEGRSALVFYPLGTRVATEAAFTLPNGRTLVNVVYGGLGVQPPLYKVWAFHPLNPWKDRFHFYLRLLMETGLSPLYIRRVM